MQFVTAEEAIKIFDALEAMDLPHGYVEEGCFARAHLMCRYLEAQGMDVKKAWVIEERAKFMRPLLPDGGDDRKAPYFRYHVAPCLSVETMDGDVEEMVFDPAFFDGPVTLDEWAFVIDADPPEVQVKAFGAPPEGYKGDYMIISAPEYTGAHTDQKARDLCARHTEKLEGKNERSVYKSDFRASLKQDFLLKNFARQASPSIRAVDQPDFPRIRKSYVGLLAEDYDSFDFKI